MVVRFLPTIRSCRPSEARVRGGCHRDARRSGETGLLRDRLSDKHDHASPPEPRERIGLVGFGIILFVLYELLVDLPGALSYTTGIAVAPDLAFGLRFFAFVFVALGAIMGLSAVRDRR